VEVFDARPRTLVTRLFPLAMLQWFFGLFGIKIPLPEDVRFLRDCDVLLDIGGITFNDGRLLFLLFNVFTIWPAMLMKVPVVKLSQAMGPFKNPINHFVSRIFLGHCSHIFARGNETAAYLDNLSLPKTKWTLAADVAFLYQAAYALSSENQEKVEDCLVWLKKRSNEENERIIAFSPSVLLMEKAEKRGLDYGKIQLDLVQAVDERNHRYIFFPNASRESSEKSRNNDIIAIRNIREKAKKILSEELSQRIYWVDFDINTAAIRQITSVSDLLVTSRFHAMVSGLVCSTPTVVIGWSHKYRETLQSFGMAEYAFNLDSSPEGLTEKVRYALAHLEEIQQVLDEAQEENRISASNQFDLLKELVRWKN